LESCVVQDRKFGSTVVDKVQFQFVLIIYGGSPRVLRTRRRAMALNSSRLSRHIMAASTLAPLSSLGSVGGRETEISGYLGRG